jgi:hypothetical protein
LIKVGDLVKYVWTDAVGLVVERGYDDRSDTVILLVEWPEWYAEKMNAMSNRWWTRKDRYLIKVKKEE